MFSGGRGRGLEACRHVRGTCKRGDVERLVHSRAFLASLVDSPSRSALPMASSSKVTLDMSSRSVSSFSPTKDRFRTAATAAATSQTPGHENSVELLNWALRNGVAPATQSRLYDRPSREQSRDIHREEAAVVRALPRRRLRPGPHRGAFKCNEDPTLLKAWYNKMRLDDLLGGDGIFGVDDAQKGLGWRAVTHKSWGNGLVDNQDRIRFIGRRLLHATLISALHMALVSTHIQSERSVAPPQGRSEAESKSKDLQSSLSLSSTLLRLLTSTSLSKLLDPANSLADISAQSGLSQLLRWNPAYMDDTRLSGLRKIQGESVEAVLGAVWHVGGQKRAEDLVWTWIWPSMAVSPNVRDAVQAANGPTSIDDTP